MNEDEYPDGWDADDYSEDDCYEHDPFLHDGEADADALSSAGWGDDESYGYFGGDDY